MIYAGTGHRPPRLGLGHAPADQIRLRSFVVARFPVDATRVVSGMAQGLDQALAEAAVLKKVPFTAAVPFEGMDKRWPDEARRRFRSLLDQAAHVVVVSPGGYAHEKFIVRDHWMVDHAEAVLALYDEEETKSGTGATVRYARKTGKPVTNLWSEWAALRAS